MILEEEKGGINKIRNSSSIRHKKSYDENESSKDNIFISELKENTPYLIIKKLDNGEHYAVSTKGVEIGRDKTCEIQIHDREVSKFNSKIVYAEGSFYLSDKKSLNGTFIKMDKSFSKAKIQLKMVIDINDFLIKVLDVSNVSIILEINDIANEKTFQEKIYILGDKINCFSIDPTKEKGYFLCLKDRLIGKYDIEFKLVQDNKIMSLSPSPANE